MLSNTSQFKEAALAFQEFGRYTNHPVNSHSKSQYRMFWDEQKRRSLEGYHIGSDYIPGYYYFYLNFCPIYKLVYDENKIKVQDRVTADRIFDFPNVWDGDYKFYHYIDEAEKIGKHALVAKARGKGFSFKMASLGNRNYFLIPGSKSFYAASDKQFLISDGILNKAWDMMDFIDKNTPWTKRRQFKNTLFHRKASYEKIDGSKKIESGYKSEIMGISLKGDPDRIRGKRGKLLVIEEGGNMKELKRLWNIARSGMEQGMTTFGLIVGGGTGGEDYADLEGLEDLFYYPDAYNIHSVDNIWDKSANGNKSSYFFPDYMNYEGCYDKDGNSDVILAKSIEEKNRDTLSKAAKSKTTLTQYIAEHAFTPQEAFLQQTATKFCVLELREQLAEIEVNHSKYRDRNWVGSLLVNNTGKVEWKLDPNVSPIEDYPIKNDNKDGCWVIYEQPQLIDGKIPFGFYIAGCLPPGEKVLTDKGLKNIELVDKNDNLYDITGQSTEIKEFTKYYVENYDLYNIKVSNTYRITTFTGEHPIFASIPKIKYIHSKKAKRLGVRQDYKEFDFKFIETKNLTKDYWVKIPNIYRNPNIVDVNSFWIDNCRVDRLIENPICNKDFWWFIGLFLGDGWTENEGHRISISFNITDKISMDRFKNIVRNIFKRHYYEKTKNNCVEISFCLLELKEFIDSHFKRHALNKIIPEWVKRLPIELKKEVVSGYLASDGCVFKGKYYTTEFVSINLGLLEGIQDILFSIGVISGITLLRNAKKTIIRGREVNQREAYHLRLNNYDTLTLLKLIPDNEKMLNIPKEYVESCTSKRYNKQCFLDDNLEYYYLQITNISKSKYTGYVYNFNTKDNTYMCHHLPTHNTDPYEQDDAQTDSVGSTLIMNTLTDRIVAEYTGRPRTAYEYYENVRKGLMYYNAICNYENDVRGMYDYFYNNNCLYLLCETPSILLDRNVISHEVAQRKYGTPSTEGVKKWGLELIKQWLITPNAVEKEILNVYKIKSPGLLKELLHYYPDGNFDRISALIQLMWLKQEYYKKIQNPVNKNYKNVNNDPFWNRVFTKKPATQLNFSVL